MFMARLDFKFQPCGINCMSESNCVIIYSTLSMLIEKSLLMMGLNSNINGPIGLNWQKRKKRAIVPV